MKSLNASVLRLSLFLLAHLPSLWLCSHAANAAVVTVCDEPALRAAVSAGGAITFGCDGVITLSSPIEIRADTILDAGGRNVNISGNHQVRIFEIFPGNSLTLVNLTISGGQSTNGSAVYNLGGSLTLIGCIFTNNHAFGAAGASGVNGLDGSAATPGSPGTPGFTAQGGAIFNAGILNATNTLFIYNTAEGGPGGAGGRGGTGLYDRACLTPGGNGGDGASGGDARGGAIYNAGSASLVAVEFTSNVAKGGSGGTGGESGGCACGGASGYGGSGGAADGAAIVNAGTLQLEASTASNNEALAGDGGTGGPFTTMGAAVSGGPGGVARGGVLHNSGTNILVNTTFALNHASGGAGGPGGIYFGSYYLFSGNGGNSHGGAIYNTGSTYITNATIWNNLGVAGLGTNALGSPPGTNGLVFGNTIQNTNGVLIIRNSIIGNLLATNNCFGEINDATYSLSSDCSCALGISSRTNTDPKLGPLRNNGGFTRTMALLPNSPALDACHTFNYPLTDQRGVRRPGGNFVDMGAYEMSLLNISVIPDERVQITYYGAPLSTYTLQSATQLTNWVR